MSTKEFNNNKIALRKAVRQTKEQLKGVAKKKTVTTYPKGVWKKTLKENFEENLSKLNRKPAVKKSTRKLKPSTKKITVKRAKIKKR
ncbi:hypothetical protein [Emticicia sp. 17c]|uniref:hypothetical protein n=1 Tax=Emticicia sp. 17c TaxID=3127704 RepID=UPI00301C0458